MLPPKRLMTLLDQSAEFQTDLCLRHNLRSGLSDGVPAPLDPSYLTKDHKCAEDDFPCETIQILTDHCEGTEKHNVKMMILLVFRIYSNFAIFQRCGTAVSPPTASSWPPAARTSTSTSSTSTLRPWRSSSTKALKDIITARPVLLGALTVPSWLCVAQRSRTR